MKGFYSPIDQLAAQLPRTKGTGAEFMTELSKRPGYKPQEAQDRELQTLMALPKMERAKFLEALKAKPAPELQESTLAKSILKNRGLNVLPDEPTKYEDYSLPGGSNYREILLRMPHDAQRAKEFSDPSSGHWDQPNVLAHVRAKDRTGPNGEKVLHIEEIQSDWHQQGRDRGYATPEGLQQFKAAQLAHRRLKEQLEEAKFYSTDIDKKLNSGMPLYQDPEVRQRMEAAKVEHNNNVMGLMPQVMKAQAEAQDLGHKLNNVVPNAPFKKNWHELALKKMIHHAAANGYDSIAITPGQEQAKRYDLSKHINAIEYERSDDGNRYTLSAIGPHGNRVHDESGIPISRVEELVGKEMANKIENNVGKVNNENYLVKTKNGDVVFETKSIRDAKEFARVHPETTDVISSNDPSNKNGLRTLSGLDLQVGGEGMKGFYDKMIPSFLNQFGKKYGAQVGKIQVPVKHELQGLRTMGGYKDEPPLDLHHFPITPQMREDVTKNGVPLYAEGGSIKNTAIHLKGLGKFFKQEDPLASHVPERTNSIYALHPDKWESTFFSLTNKDPRKLRYFKPEHINVPEGTLVGDMIHANRFYSAKTNDEKQKHAQAYRESLKPYPADLSGYRMPELLIPQNKMKKGGSVEDEEPKKTVKAYKMFRVDKKQPGKLFPLFVDSNTPVDMDKWITAKEGEKSTTNTKKVKSKIGDLAYRPGWHAGDLPIATHIGDKDEEQKAEARRIRELRDAHAAVLGNSKAAKAMARKEHPYPSWVNAPRLRNPNHIWAEVEMPNDVDWQSEATKRGYNDQGKLIASQAHITDQLPKGGHYRYKTNSNMLGNWLIGGSMKVNRILHDKEVEAINKAAGAADLPRAKAMNQKAFGFAEGGTVGPEEWMAEEHVNHKAKGGKAEFLKDSKVKNVLYRGGVGHPDMSEDFLKGKARPGYATFASTSPHVAGSYAHPDQDEVGAIAPMHIKVHTVHEFPVTTDKHGSRKFDKFAFDRRAQQLQPGHALVARQVHDMGPRASTKTDPDKLYSYPSDIYAWNKGTETKSALSKAKGGSVKPIGYTKEKVTVSPNLDQMRYELMSVKHSVKKVK